MKKILVANRGEIAIRVMKTARKMGIETVAVYSEADRNSPHVRYADEAVFIGNAPSSESYLVHEKIINAVKSTGADAIHPGYGFLSENATFTELVKKNGITFIGPSPHAMRIMGSKLDAKEAVKKYNIPMVEGIDQAIEDVDEAKKIADGIGYPILIKASAGGGGKGMRIVNKSDELKEQMERAISEAKSAFGDGSVFIEKYVSSPRHIEIQVLADNHGNVIHLFERECSIQRRHQKVVEEAPSAILTPEKRRQMGEDAVKVAMSCQYSGAGTVEFLLDDQMNHYFLEMNTRLQVEHPVTEMITGVDLVEQQIRVARNEKLSIQQSDLTIKGHAIELRIYAEDPTNNFLPSIGKIGDYTFPTGRDIRLDSGYESNMDIPIYYDPMLAKLAVYGENRAAAIEKMSEVLAASKITGLETTIPFGRFVCNHDAFKSGNYNTHFVKNYFSPELIQADEKTVAELAAVAGLKHYLKELRKLRVPS